MSDHQTARLGLPYLAAGQMQKHVTLNEALTRLDALVQTTVASAVTTAQPPDPADGVLYILPPGATGPVWSGRPAGSLMRAEAGGWTQVAPPDGLVVLIQDEGRMRLRDAGTWVDVGARLGAVQNLDRWGLGTTADAANPFAARLNRALWTALETGAGGDGDLRLTLNKQSAGDVLSLLFQSGWSGRAEIGLIGDDDLRLKVSNDGSGWTEAMAIDRASGRVSFPMGAGRCVASAFTVDGDYSVPPWAVSVEAIAVGGGGGGGSGASGASGSRFGGGGGGGGGVVRARWRAAALLSGALTVAVGRGGAGGTTAEGAGGGDSLVRLAGMALMTACGGGGGLGGVGGGAAGAGGPGTPASNGGGASSVAAAAEAGRSLDRPDAPGGGGGGGGLSGSDVAGAGGAGGDGGALAVRAEGGAGGSGGPGGGGAAAPQPTLHWAGGGGGGGGATAGAGHPGGAGGVAGGGGGGGGAGISTGGIGGTGADGVVWLVATG